MILINMELQERARLEYLDGLRGAAILTVALFHGYARWTNLYPYGDQFVGNPVLDTGWDGVRLFFMISGFVILMTLHRSPSFSNFIWKRWLRLFPAMLICSALIFLSADIFSERPGGAVKISDLLPGLTFTGAEDGNRIWDWIGGIKSLEGSFWSLYAEVKFYIIFGAAYFIFGQRGAIVTIVFLFLLGVLLNQLYVSYPNSQIFAAAGKLAFLLRLREYGWFAAGSLAFLWTLSKRPALFILAAIVTAASLKFSSSLSPASIFLSSLFLGSLIFTFLRRALSNGLLLFLGAASYPLYLLHENILVASIVKLGRVLPRELFPVLPLMPIALLTITGWFIAKFAEPLVRRVLVVTFESRTKPATAVRAAD